MKQLLLYLFLWLFAGTLCPCPTWAQTPCAPVAGLKAQFSFEETQGTTAQDATGQLPAATLYAGAWQPTGGPDGGGALQLTGAAHLDIKLSPVDWQPTDFSLSFWLKPLNLSDYGQQVGAVRGWGGFLFHSTSNGTVVVGTDAPTNSRLEIPNANLQKNIWQHFVFTFAKGTATLYQNGVMVATKAGLPLPQAWQGMRLGSNGSGDSKGDAVYDELRVYDRALTDEEARTLFSCPSAASYLPPATPNSNLDHNWTLERSFDGEGQVVAESKQFTDALGRPTQAQARNAATKQVFAAQTIYNTGGQPVLQTLAAPTNNQDFSYKEGFITSNNGIPYTAGNFEPGTAAIPPSPVDATTPGTLGYYYSKQNAQEPLTPTTSYPYSLTEMYQGPLGGVKRAAGPGDAFRMGSGHEAQGREFLVRKEFDNYLSLRPHFVPGSPTSSLEYQALKAVSIDADGRESIVVTNKEGQTLLTCLSGPQYTALPVFGFISAEVTNTHDANAPPYVDIHIPAGSGQDVKFTMDGQATRGGRVLIVNLRTDDTTSYPLAAASGGVGPERHIALAPGFYRLLSVTGTQWYFYEAHYGNFSYTYYDDAGRAIATVAPNGLAGGNLLRNPGFEQDPNSTTASSGWQVQNNRVAATYSQLAGENNNPPAHGGQGYGVHWTGQPNGHNSFTFQQLTGLPNGLYTARAWVKNTNINTANYPSEVAQLLIKEYNNAGSQLWTDIPITGSGGDWVQVQVTDIPVTNGQCLVALWSTTPKDDWIAFDDVEFVRQADSSLPSFVTRNTYDTSGRLLATQSQEEGRSEYVYARDGRIRFSQSELQRPAGRFSYSNYDEAGRVVESGEYTPAATGTAGVEFESHTTNAGKLTYSLKQEAEDAWFANTLGDGSTSALRAGASGGKAVTNLTQPGNFVEFNLSVPPGQSAYQLQIRYAAGSGARKMTLRVNGVNGAGGDIQSLVFPTTNDWNHYATLPANVTLVGGQVNTLRIEYAAGDDGSIDLDYLQASPPLFQEAEDAAFADSNGSQPEGQALASGGFDVAYLTSPGNFVKFAVDVPTGQAGAYELQLQYSAGMGNAQTMSVRVGANAGQHYTFPTTRSWYTYSTLHVAANLQAGTNYIWVEYASGDNGYINLDYLRAVPAASFSFKQEAEQVPFRNHYNNAPIAYSAASNSAGASGGQEVGFLNGEGTGVDFHVTAPQAGTYTLRLAYATGGYDTRTLTLLLNDEPPAQLQFPGNSSWNTYTTLSRTVSLREGANSIQVVFAPGDNGNANLDYLQVEAQFGQLSHDQSVHDVVEDRTRTGGLTLANCSQRNQVWYDLTWDGADDATQQDSKLGTRRQQFVLGAVAKTKNDNVTTWYSYDELGRVTWVVQDIQHVGTKTLDYTYDFSGNVLQVAYQQGQPDSFYHYYTYDAAQRLTQVQTSPDGVTKTMQAEYSYYLHGPLKRVQVAGDLQGVDYTYTLQGALKNINHVNPALEPGHDAPGTNGVYKDLFALSLDYFSGDYASRRLAVTAPTGAPATTGPDRYDGTIQGAAWRTPASPAIRRVAYTYDEKSQLQNSRFGEQTLPGASSLFTVAATKALQEGGLTYDQNGNMQSLRRTDQNGAVTDNFSYSYKANTNQLQSVHTGSPSGATVLDYDYDELGQTTRQRDEQGQRYLTYDVTGKTTGLYADAAHTQPITTFAYDDRGFRVSKATYSASFALANTTYYVRDVAGNTLAVYEQPVAAAAPQRTEVPLYGSGRLGMLLHLDNGTPAGLDDYRYELSDHLGDARVVFHRPTTVVYTATMEPGAASQEERDFTNVTTTRFPFFGHNKSATVARLGFDAGTDIGPSKVLNVQRGDTVTFTAYAWLTKALAADPAPSSVRASRLPTWLGWAAPLAGAAAGPAPLPTDQGRPAGGFHPFARLGLGAAFTFGTQRRSQPPTNDEAPTVQGNAQMHYIIRDEQGREVFSDYQLVNASSPGYWHPLQVGLRLQQAGTVELRVETYGAKGPDVYFDDIRIEQTSGLIVQEQHQYAYGAPLPGLSYTVGNRRYRHGYQGQYAEHDTLTGFESFELRLYNSRVGRWLSYDPEGQFDSPYVGMGNNPVSGVDPTGGWSPSSALVGGIWGAAGGAVIGGAIGYANEGWSGVAGGAALGAVGGGIIGGAIGNYVGNLEPNALYEARPGVGNLRSSLGHVKPEIENGKLLLSVHLQSQFIEEEGSSPLTIRWFQTYVTNRYLNGDAPHKRIIDIHDRTVTNLTNKMFWPKRTELTKWYLDSESQKYLDEESDELSSLRSYRSEHQDTPGTTYNKKSIKYRFETTLVAVSENNIAQPERALLNFSWGYKIVKGRVALYNINYHRLSRKQAKLLYQR